MTTSSSSDGDVGYAYPTNLISTSDGPNNWDPGQIQDDINTEIGYVTGMLAAGKDPTYALYYIMFLMQQYGVQQVGQQADEQNNINVYFNKIQDAWNMLHSADSDKGVAGVTTQFLDDLNNIKHLILYGGDSFFKAHPDMAKEILGNVNSLYDLVHTGINSALSKYYKGDPLYILWTAYSGREINGHPAPSGAHEIGVDLMDQVNRMMGQMNSQFTGESQSVTAVTQAEAKTQQAEQDQMNNFLKSIQKLLSYFNQQFKTS